LSIRTTIDQRGFFVVARPLLDSEALRSMYWSLVHRCIALLLACNYFAFQVELFEEEYEANHPKTCEGSSFTHPTLTWESFDKENAPQAFVFDAEIQIQFLFFIDSEPSDAVSPNNQYQPVRDKSPPEG
jgi:hypothetical protein